MSPFITSQSKFLSSCLIVAFMHIAGKLLISYTIDKYSP